MGQEHLGDFGTLAHNTDPWGELGVVLGGGQRNVVALLADLSHGVLVDNGEDEAIVAGILEALLFSLTDAEVLSLLAVEGGDGDLGLLAGTSHALEEETKTELRDQRKGVVALEQAELDVDASNILATGSVAEEDVLALLAQDLGVNVVASRHGDIRRDGGWVDLLAKSDVSELILKSVHVAADPSICAAAVGANTPEVDEDGKEEEGNDEALGLEVAPGHALVYVVPLGERTVRDVDLCAECLVSRRSRESARQRCRRRRRCVCEVGKV